MIQNRGEPPANSGIVGEYACHMALIQISGIGTYQNDIRSRPCRRDMAVHPVVYQLDSATSDLAGAITGHWCHCGVEVVTTATDSDSSVGSALSSLALSVGTKRRNRGPQPYSAPWLVYSIVDCQKMEEILSYARGPGLFVGSL